MRSPLSIVTLICSLLLPCQRLSAQLQGVLISRDQHGRIVVDPVDPARLGERANQQGILIWEQQGQDRWKILPAPATSPERSQPELAEVESNAASIARLSSASRGSWSPSSSGAIPATTLLVQLVGQATFRGESFLTPQEGATLLVGKPTIRRRSVTKGGTAFPAVELQLQQGTRTLLRVGLDEGEEVLRWDDIDGLPGNLKGGLPPGRYVLRIAGTAASSSFTVAPSGEAGAVLAPAKKLSDLVGKEGPLLLQLQVESLLSHRDRDGSIKSFPVDAFDLLDSPDTQKQLTPALRQLHAELKQKFSAGAEAGVQQDSDSTGIAAVDGARQQLNRNDWGKAIDELRASIRSEDRRTRGLAQLYTAVAMAEASHAGSEATAEMFQNALLTLQSIEEPSAQDLLRAENNFAAFLMNRSQDRLYNHAFQMASGVQSPLMHAMVDWLFASQQLGDALGTAELLNPTEVSIIRLNSARLQSLLADLLRTLQGQAPSETISSLISQAGKEAEESLHLVLKDQSLSSLQRASASELLAHLAFRRSDVKACEHQLDLALAGYLDGGSLAGCESVYRTRGLLQVNGDDSAISPERRELALRDLKVSQLLSSVLRARVPADEVGQTAAGFFARRAYVREAMIDLLIETGKAEEALIALEEGKARSLQDVLSASRQGAAASESVSYSTEVLKDWPSKVAAVEYFIGSERSWMFFVNTTGKVQVTLLTDENKRPIPSRELLTRTQNVMERLDRLGPAEGRRIATAARGSRKPTFEQSWQHELGWFYNVLIPEQFREELRQAETLVIVPHHLLHYLPFAALVTQVDEKAVDPTQMPMPKFFVEEPFSLVHAPSLSTWRLLRERVNRPLEEIHILGIMDFGGRAANLPGVRAEIANLQKIFGSKVTEILTDEKATESAVRTLLSKPGIASLSTHGQKMPDRPLETFLMCQPDQQHDGFLRAVEIYGMDVQADIVLLNACYGGFADRSPHPGDDLFGIQRALLQRGARTVVSGMWDIYDSTAPDIMNDFWTEVASGVSAPRALADAQRRYLQTWRTIPSEPLRFLSHPYYWAVFTVSGDDRTGASHSKVEAKGRAENLGND